MIAQVSRITQAQLDVINALKQCVFPFPQVGKIPNPNNKFNYWNIWDDQIDDMLKGSGYSFQCPAFFVEFILSEGKSFGDKYQYYQDSVFNIYICGVLLDGGMQTLEQNLMIFTMRDIVKTQLLNYNSTGLPALITGCSSFACTEDKMDYKHGNLYKYKLGFKTCFVDIKGAIFDPNSGIKLGTIPSINYTANLA
jgi:hypothetical protein